MGVGGAAGEEQRVSIRIYRPAPPLQSYVTFFHIVDVDGPIADFLYPEWGNVRFALSGEWDVQMPGRPARTPQRGALFGPTDRHSKVVTQGGRTLGFGLTPIGWHRLLGEPAAPMANRVRPLRHELGICGDALNDELAAMDDDQAMVTRLEELLAERLAMRPPVNPLVLAVDAALRQRPATVIEFADLLGVSETRLRRICLAVFGFPSKRVLRMQRFLDVLGHVRTAVGQPIDQSIEPDYFDQSHFYRDFRDFMAMSARTYFSAPRPLMAEAAAAQVRAGVTLSFRLPPPPES